MYRGEEEEKITLDRNTFKTLASDTRVGILKSLTVRRKTLSELAREYKMSVSTVKEHLDQLVNADLIEQKDEGHKWKYYELTRKGKGVLNPEDKKIWVLLSVSAVAALMTGLDAFTGFVGRGWSALSSASIVQDTSKIAEGAGELIKDAVPMATGTAGETATGAVTETFAATAAIPWLHICLIAAFMAVAGLSILRMAKFRKRLI